MNIETHCGFGMTRREFEKYKSLAYAHLDIKENQKKFRKKITDADISYMVKAMEAPDVNLFLALI